MEGVFYNKTQTGTHIIIRLIHSSLKVEYLSLYLSDDVYWSDEVSLPLMSKNCYPVIVRLCRWQLLPARGHRCGQSRIPFE